MSRHEIVSEDQWIAARRVLLAEEKALTETRDALAEKRRALPWIKVEKDYVFEGVLGGAEGPVRLADLFDGRSQLVVYHFMFGPEWEEGCPGCSLLCDHVDGARQHFEHNDLSFVAVSRAPIGKLQAYCQRMGWNFNWVSAAGNDFNFDYRVSFPAGSREDGVIYNFERMPDPKIDELPGASVFFRDADGAIYHTYSSYGRGGEGFLGVYAWLDIAPLGRREASGDMSDWMRRHDSYDGDGRTPAPAIAAAN